MTWLEISVTPYWERIEFLCVIPKIWMEWANFSRLDPSGIKNTAPFLTIGPKSGMHRFMSPLAEKILQDIRTLPPEDQLAISERLSKYLIDELPVPDRVRVRSEAELKDKIRQGLEGIPVPVTDQFGNELHKEVEERDSGLA